MSSICKLRNRARNIITQCIYNILHVPETPFGINPPIDSNQTHDTTIHVNTDKPRNVLNHIQHNPIQLNPNAKHHCNPSNPYPPTAQQNRRCEKVTIVPVEKELEKITVMKPLYTRQQRRIYLNVKRIIARGINKCNDSNDSCQAIIQQYETGLVTHGNDLGSVECDTLINRHLIDDTFVKLSDGIFDSPDHFASFCIKLIRSIFQPGRASGFGSIKSVISHNSGGFSENAQTVSESISKGRVQRLIRRAYSKGIVLWQETKMNDGLAAAIQQYDPNINIVHSSPNKHSPYGVAILWPRHRYGDYTWASTIVPGCAVAAGLDTADGPTAIICVYAPKKRLDEVLEAVCNFLPRVDNHSIAIVGGDWNFHTGGDDYRDKVNLSLANKGLMPGSDNANSKNTYRYGTQYTHLDDIHIRHPNTNDGTSQIRFNANFEHKGSYEHAHVRVEITHVKYPDIGQFVKFEHLKLDKLHPNSKEAQVIRDKVNNEVNGRTPQEVQQQIAGIAHAAGLKINTQGLDSDDRQAFRRHLVWQSMRKAVRHSRAPLVRVTQAAVNDLNNSVRMMTNTHGLHDLRASCGKNVTTSEQDINSNGAAEAPTEDVIGNYEHLQTVTDEMPQTDHSRSLGSGMVGKGISQDQGRNKANNTHIEVKRAELAAKLRFIDLLVSQKRAVTEIYNKRAAKGGPGKATSTKLKEKEGNLDGQLTALYTQPQSDPNIKYPEEKGLPLTKSLEELGRTVRSNRPHLRETTFDAPPVQLSNDQERFIEWYGTVAPTITSLPPPPRAAFIKRISYSNDSGVGTDSIPNAFYRIDPELFGEILCWEIEYRACNIIEKDELMNQLLTWIPKASVGLSNENWRPLSVPTTWLRLLTGGVTDHVTTDWKDALDMNQTLAGDFKEAHANYRRAQNILEGQDTQHEELQETFTSVLFTDLVKAFELINPRWVWAILEARRAPRWLRQIVMAFTGPRKATAKIMGRLLPPVYVNIGVDMGNALAPWIFCLALDPLIRYANRIPNVIKMQAYMDDTNSAGSGYKWLQQIQKMWGAVDSAGLHIARHTCCVVECEGDLIKAETYSSTLIALRSSKGGSQKVTINDQTRSINEFLDEQGRTCPVTLRNAFNKGCSCKGVKTKLLLRSPPNDQVLQALDLTPYGMMITATQDRCLGLNAITPRRETDGKASVLTQTQKSDLVFGPYIEKVEKRASKRIFYGGVIHDKLVDWKTYTVSKVLYPAQQYRPSAATIKRLDASLTRTLNLGHLTEASKTQPILRAIGMTSVTNTARTLDATIINAVIRQHGAQVLLEVHEDQQIKDATAAFFDLQFEAISSNTRDEAIGKISSGSREQQTKYIKKICGDVDFHQSKLITIDALQPSFDKWTQSNEAGKRVIEKFNKVKTSAISVPQRMSWLKWLKMHDHDAYKRSLILERPKPYRRKECCICQKGDPLMYPNGTRGYAYCKEHNPFAREDFLTDELADFIQYDPNRGAFQTTPYDHEITTMTTEGQTVACKEERIKYCADETCTLCKKSQGTIRHWVHECPVVTAFVTKVGCPHLDTAFDPGEDCLDFARTICCMHQVRLMLIRDRCIGIPTLQTTRRNPVQAVKELLEAYMRYACRSLLTTASHARMLTSTADKRQIENKGCAGARVGREVFTTRTYELTLTATKDFQAGDDILCVHTPNTTIPSLHSTHPGLPNPKHCPKPNAHWKCTIHGSDARTFHLKACKELKRGDIITVRNTDSYEPTGNTLLARFDGSAKEHKGEHSAGCGVVIYIGSDNDLLEKVATYATPLPSVESSDEAEAAGALKAGAAIASLLCEPRFRGFKAEIQGDNIAIIKYNQGTSRLNNPHVFSMFRPLRDKVNEHNLCIKWTHIPREHNTVADKLAGNARDAVAKKTYLANIDIDGDLIAQEYHTSIDKNLNEVKTEAIRYLQSLNHNGESQGQLTLPEYYSVKNDDIHSDLPLGTLVTVLKFVRTRRQLAKYGAAAGHDKVSRHYVRSGGVAGSSSNKTARYILLNDHYEADISSCFHTVIRSCTPDRSCPLTKPHEEAIRYITANIGEHVDKVKVAKAILQRMITAGADSIRWQIRRDFNTDISHGLHFELDTFHRLHKDRIVESMKRRGFIGCSDQSKITDSNKLYFTCEAAETSIMTRALQRVLAHCDTDSVVWLHDGMYVNNKVPESFTRDAIIQAAGTLGIDEVVVKITKCSEHVTPSLLVPDPSTAEKRRSIVNEIHRLNANRGNNPPNVSDEFNIDIDKPLGRIRSILMM